MIFLLDSNVVSELRKAADGRADTNVTAWAEGLAPESLYISAISLMELEIGVRGKERKDAVQGQMLRTWLDRHVIPFFDGRIVPIDDVVAIQCAKLHVPDRKSERDALIAATALVHDMIVATRNEKDFVETGVRLLNPWTGTNGNQA
ncbi:type II toxin-antitoxin system VapC family toxin [Cognatishimia activa]|uniref:Putative ribonuclease FitB n=1 Tax=Cognatishimia activa TaxID=1715691 RepID=A0A0P1IPJ4_9RHOB|nr:type II toxin-antitoxin system VapC family toxin [Cognatishimia activa]CUI85274.1 putative ribonuclease FitB [Cognatishimia activa]CUK25548.1 putative ribonuclease FitB [Cognatishimia activa]